MRRSADRRASRVDLEARHAGAQLVRDERQVVDRLRRLAQRLGGLLRGFRQLRQRLGDLLGAVRLRLHPFVDHLEARRERLHLGDDLRQLPADLLHVEHPAAHFLGELVHPHHARRHGRLDFLHRLLDVVGRDGRLVGEAADLGRDDREAAAVFAGLLGLDRRVQRQQVGLVGHLGDRRDHLVDVQRLLVEDRELRVHRTGRVHHAAHRLAHPREPALAHARERRRLLGHAGHLVHRAQQVARRREDLARGRADLGRRRRGFVRGRLLLARRRRDLGDRRRHLQRRLLRARDELGQLVGHPVEARLERAEFVAAAQVEAARQVAGAHHVVHLDEPRHRHGDRTVQHVAEPERGQQHDRQRGREHDLGILHGFADQLRGLVGELAVFLHQDVRVAHDLAPHGLHLRIGRNGLVARYAVFLHGFVQQRQVAVVGAAKRCEALTVVVTERRVLVFDRQRLDFLQRFGNFREIALHAFGIGIDERCLLQQRERFVHRAAQRRREVDAGQRVALDADGFAVDRAQALVRHAGCHQHQHEQHAEAEQDAIAERQPGSADRRMQAFIGRTGRHGGHVRYGLSKISVEKIHARQRAGRRATSASWSEADDAAPAGRAAKSPLRLRRQSKRDHEAARRIAHQNLAAMPRRRRADEREPEAEAAARRAMRGFELHERLGRGRALLRCDAGAGILDADQPGAVLAAQRAVHVRAGRAVLQPVVDQVRDRAREHHAVAHRHALGIGHVRDDPAAAPGRLLPKLVDGIEHDLVETHDLVRAALGLCAGQVDETVGERKRTPRMAGDALHDRRHVAVFGPVDVEQREDRRLRRTHVVRQEIERLVALPRHQIRIRVIADPRGQLHCVGELHQIVVRAGDERLALDDRLLLRGQHDDRHPCGAGVCAPCANEIEAVDVRHHEILQDDRRLHVARDRHRPVRVGAHVQVDVVFAAQRAADHFADERLIVDEKDRKPRFKTIRGIITARFFHKYSFKRRISNRFFHRSCLSDLDTILYWRLINPA
ncbi:hypothetical protein EMIT0111MI5_11052 [Burkholderia sp. IT-111MI5]